MPQNNESILEKSVNEGMSVFFEFHKFKKSHPTLFNCILTAMDRARIDELKTHNEAVNPKEKGC